MIGNAGLRMTCRIGVEVDPDRTAVAPVVNLDGQILDRSQRQVSRLGPTAGKAEIVVEPHDIEIEPEQRAVVVDPTDFAAQIRNLKTPVLKPAPDFLGRLSDQVRHGHSRIDLEP